MNQTTPTRTTRTWKQITIVFTFCLLAAHAMATPRLPGFFTNNMVLQCDAKVPVWGWADPGESVTVSFAGQTATATADADGKWSLKLNAMPASAEARNLTVSTTGASTPTITLANIVVGEVWICSGQSNMEWTINNSMNAQQERAAATYPLIRHMKVGHTTADVPRDNLHSSWEICSANTAGNFTAVGYFFARKLHQELNVPIGLIGSNWGGTRVEPWTAPEGFRAVPELQSTATHVDATLPTTPTGQAAYRKALGEMREWLPTAEAAIEKGKNPPAQPKLPAVGTGHQDPTRIYNAMIHPLIPYAFRGAIWYQGESNGGEGVSYFQKKKALIGGWRKLWNQGDFPFYFVQLADFQHPNNNPAGGDGWARIREAQRATLSIPNTGMAVIIDIGAANDIHPRNKQDVGVRLALWALANDYGQKDLVYSGPLYKGHTVEGNAIRVNFDHVGSGLMVGKKEGLAPTAEIADGKLARFAIAGADKQWHWADAVIDDGSVLVSSPNVTAPVAVRYAYSMNPDGCNLYNREGLPASPFRTDNW